MARSGIRPATRGRGIDLRALRSRRDALPVSNGFSAVNPDPAVLVEAQAVAAKVAAGDWTLANKILTSSRPVLGQGRPALTIVERAVIDRFACDKKGEVIDGFARRYLTMLKAERRYSPDMARASYQGGAVVHLRKGSDEKGRFQSFCGRTFWPVPVRRGTAVASQHPMEERPLGMEAADMCQRCAKHLDKIPGLMEPVRFPVLTVGERARVELAALHGFCEQPDGVPEWRVRRHIAVELQRIAIERIGRFTARDFDRAWIYETLGLRSGFFRAYGADHSAWPVPNEDQLSQAIAGHPTALVLERQDETYEVLYRNGRDEMIDQVLPALLGSCWIEARDACAVKDAAEIQDGVLGGSDRRLRTMILAAGRDL